MPDKAASSPPIMPHSGLLPCYIIVSLTTDTTHRPDRFKARDGDELAPNKLPPQRPEDIIAQTLPHRHRPMSSVRSRCQFAPTAEKSVKEECRTRDLSSSVYRARAAVAPLHAIRFRIPRCRRNQHPLARREPVTSAASRTPRGDEMIYFEDPMEKY